MKIERRITKCTVKFESRAEGEPKKISGLGAVTYNGTPETEYVLWDFGSERCVERIMPGAFDKAISRPDDVRGLFNHDANQVLGRTKSGTMKLGVDEGGLAYDIDPGDTTTGRDVSVHLNRGDVDGSSIAFIVDEERWTETKDAAGKWNVLREILSVTLYDTGPVTFPAYTATTASLRAAGDADEAKQSLKAYRDAKPPEAGPKLPGVIAGYMARSAAAIAESN